MPVKKIALAVLLATVVILYFVGGGDKYLSISLLLITIDEKI